MTEAEAVTVTVTVTVAESETVIVTVAVNRILSLNNNPDSGCRFGYKTTQNLTNRIKTLI